MRSNAALGSVRSSFYHRCTFMFSLLNTLALEKIPKGILLMQLCSMLRE